jgi:hypothetical protein
MVDIAKITVDKRKRADSIRVVIAPGSFCATTTPAFHERPERVFTLSVPRAHKALRFLV